LDETAAVSHRVRQLDRFLFQRTLFQNLHTPDLGVRTVLRELAAAAVAITSLANHAAEHPLRWCEWLRRLQKPTIFVTGSATDWSISQLILRRFVVKCKRHLGGAPHDERRIRMPNLVGNANGPASKRPADTAGQSTDTQGGAKSDS
jgi:hypothetical protein